MMRKQLISRCALCLLTLTFCLPAVSASGQEPDDDRRDRPPIPTDPQEIVPPPPLEEPNDDQGQRDAESRRERQGDDQRRPQTMLVPPGDRVPSTWRLGVYADNTSTGVVITQVVRGSAAWREGLERGDVIVAVSGYQVGFVDGRLFDLGRELQYRADRSGRVLLLVQNSRNGQLVNLHVQLEPRNMRLYSEEGDRTSRR